MTDSFVKECEYLGCFVQPSFGVPGSNKREFCSLHALEGMRNIGSKKCARQGCFKSPTYGVKDSRKRDFCAQHAVQGMVDLSTRKCGSPGCSKCATYGTKGSRKRQYCAQHALDGMVDIYRKTCAFSGCPTRPTYGTVGSRKREFCSRHAPIGMINVDTPRCAQAGCYSKASCGVNGRRKREFCPEHAAQGMVDLSTSKCATPGCCKCATYAESGGKRAFCAQHAEAGMVNIDATATPILCARDVYIKARSVEVNGGRTREVCPEHHAEAGDVWREGRHDERAEGWEVRGLPVTTSAREDHDEAWPMTVTTDQSETRATTTKRACGMDQARAEAREVQTKGRSVIDLSSSTTSASHELPSRTDQGLSPGTSVVTTPSGNVRVTRKRAWPNAPLVQTPTGWSVWNWESALNRPSAFP